MKNYNTIEEKTLEWNISTRYIQSLCRAGKIEGAVKRAGAWFLPEDTPIPAKYSKSNAKNFIFVGTKSKIFDSAIKLFSQKGFNSVSFKDIAHSVGIRQSTIYNHFKTKQELLDVIYDFYCHSYLSERLSLEDMKPIIQKESLMDIIRCIRYEFKDNCRQRMTDITKIILQRNGVDKRATEIAKSLVVDEGIQYAENVFDFAVEIGRLAPFDTHAMAVFINSMRVFTLYYWMIDTSDADKMKMLEDEKALYRCALKSVVDLKSPAAMDAGGMASSTA